MDASDETVGRYTLLTVAVGAARTRRVVLAAADSTVGELAGALGTGAGMPLWIDGRRCDPGMMLGDVGVVWGSVVDVDRRAGVQRSTAELADPVVMIRCTAGPAAGERIRLGAGRHLLGRSPVAAVRIDDPSLELHALLVDVAASGRVEVTQLTGRVPATIDSEPMSGRCALRSGSVVHIGASRFEAEWPLARGPGPSPLTRSGATSDGGDVEGDPSPWVRYWQRRERPCERRALPARAATSMPRPVPVMQPPPWAGHRCGRSHARSVVTAVVAVVAVAMMVAGSVLAVVAGTAAWLALTALAGVGLLTLRADLVTPRRRTTPVRNHRLPSAAIEDGQRRAYLERHRRQVTPVDVLVEVADAHGARLWERRVDHDDALTVTLGYGHIELGGCERSESAAPWRAAAVADDERVPLTLAPGRLVALVGDARPLARSIVAQLAITTGPSDWGLWVITDRPGEWDWTHWLPHSVSPLVRDVADRRSFAELAATLGAGTDAPRLVVCIDVAASVDSVDSADSLDDIVDGVVGSCHEPSGAGGDPAGEPERPGPVGPYAVVVLVDDEASVPAAAGTRVFVGSRHRGRWTPDRDEVPLETPVHVAGLSSRTALRVALRLACLADPDLPAQRAVRMASTPSDVHDALPFRAITTD